MRLRSLMLAALWAVGFLPAFGQTEVTTESGAKPTSPTTEAASGDKVPLEIKLPRAMFQGTPKNVNAPNLDPATGKARGPFLAPKGAVNLAAGKTVTASDKAPIIGDPAQVTDGDKEGADGSYLELGPGKQWVQLDLGQESEIYAVVMWHFHSEARVYNDVVIQSADDPDFTQNVKTLYNNDHDNSSGMGIGKDKAYVETNEGRLVDTKSAKARYLRFYSNGNTTNELNNYIEIEVYGKPAK